MRLLRDDLDEDAGIITKMTLSTMMQRAKKNKKRPAKLSFCQSNSFLNTSQERVALKQGLRKSYNDVKIIAQGGMAMKFILDRSLSDLGIESSHWYCQNVSIRMQNYLQPF